MHKKITIALLAIIAFILVGLYVLGQQSNTNNEIATAEPIHTDDQDQDGLLDWEEDLHGTNPLLSDTDGDGTSDSAEVAAGRDPLKPGPDDTLEAFEPITPEISEQELLQAKQEFFDDFLQQRADEIGDLTIAGLIEGFDASEFSGRYTLEDVQTISIATSSEAKEYGNEIANIFVKYSNATEYPDSEFDIFSTALQTQDDSDMHKLKTISLAYKNLAGELLAMQVPFGTAQNHLVFINAYDVLSRALNAMSDFFIDPVRGGGGYQAYITQGAAVRAAFIYTSDYFKKYGILFNEGEAGTLFNKPWNPT